VRGGKVRNRKNRFARWRLVLNKCGTSANSGKKIIGKGEAVRGLSLQKTSWQGGGVDAPGGRRGIPQRRRERRGS